MKDKKLVVFFAIIMVCGIIGLISRLIAGNYDVWAIIGIASSGIMTISGIVGLITYQKNKERE